jgi:hypothetical protein
MTLDTLNTHINVHAYPKHILNISKTKKQAEKQADSMKNSAKNKLFNR